MHRLQHAMTRADAEALDAADPLARFRDAFDLPRDVIYLDGNSLGPLPLAAAARVDEVVRQEWGQGLIRSWNAAGWIDAPQRIGGKLARLMGAKAHEIIAADSTSVSLYKLAAGALSLRPGRKTLLTEADNFPTDVYVLEGLCAMAGATLRIVPADDILESIDSDTAAVVLTHIHYRSSRRWDMAAVNRAATARGALSLWDLSHSVGAVQVHLNETGADLAVGCGYKFLNGGPGAPAWLFVAQRHQAAIRSPLTGWMGHAAPFAFEPAFRPAGDIRRLLTGTPPILGLAVLEAALDLQLAADPAQMEAKGLALAEAFITGVEARCAGYGLMLQGPHEAALRGLHVSFDHPEAYALIQALIARGVIGDFRDPGAARFGFSPLFLRYVDVWTAVEVLAEVLQTRAWDAPEFRVRAAVT